MSDTERILATCCLEAAWQAMQPRRPINSLGAKHRYFHRACWSSGWRMHCCLHSPAGREVGALPWVLWHQNKEPSSVRRNSAWVGPIKHLSSKHGPNHWSVGWNNKAKPFPCFKKNPNWFLFPFFLCEATTELARTCLIKKLRKPLLSKLKVCNWPAYRRGRSFPSDCHGLPLENRDYRGRLMEVRQQGCQCWYNSLSGEK